RPSRAARRRGASVTRRAPRPREQLTGDRGSGRARRARRGRRGAGGSPGTRGPRRVRRRLDGAAALRQPAPARPGGQGPRARAPAGTLARGPGRPPPDPWRGSAGAALGLLAGAADARPARHRRRRSPLPCSRGSHGGARAPRTRRGGSRGRARGAPRESGPVLEPGRRLPRGGAGAHAGRRSLMKFEWSSARTYTDIRYDVGAGDAARIARPEVRNAFRPRTLVELSDAFTAAREDPAVGVVVLTGTGPEAFCAGGDQRVRGEGGYVDEAGVPRLNVLDLQRQIRTLPKPVIAMVAGYAIGGGHVLHVICDLTTAADNAVFGQTGPRVGSFDGGYGATYLARIVGHKKAREIWYRCARYDAREALAMGLVNAVVPLDQLEAETVAGGRDILANS